MSCISVPPFPNGRPFLLREFRSSHGLLIADALIAATAIVEDVPFISKNQRDYRFIDELDLLPYPNPLSRSQ